MRDIKNMPDGLLFLLIGPSGSGKTQLIDRALNTLSGIRRYITYTTRKPRPGETHGQEYFFIKSDEFHELQSQGKLIGCQELYGSLYGSSPELLDSFISTGIDAIAAYDVLGALDLLEKYPRNVITVFVLPPSIDDLRSRLIERYGKMTPEGQLRLERFDMEILYAGRFKYLVKNIELEDAVVDVLSIIRAERCARLAREYRESS